MANNFFNAIKTDISADSTLPTAVYTTPVSKKSILIELDVANKSSSGVTVSVCMCDASQNQTHSLSGTVTNANASQVTVASGTSGLFTTTSSAAHNLIVNDRVTFTATDEPSFTDASLPPSGDTELSTATSTPTTARNRIYYVQAIGAGASPTTFKIAESESASAALTFDSAGTAVKMSKIHLADVVRDAPVPVGGSLKVISGQKLVIESQHANVNDKIFVSSSAANAVDCIASVLEDVS